MVVDIEINLEAEEHISKFGTIKKSLSTENIFLLRWILEYTRQS
jgi:hypothetical protein